MRVLVGFPAGGQIDIIARLIGQWLSDRLGQQFFIDNRPGAVSNIAAEALIRAPADGYTLFLANGTNAVNATLYDNLRFSFVHDTTRPRPASTAFRWSCTCIHHFRPRRLPR